MSTSTNLPTPDECFISVLLDEWLKDSHCLDSKEAWDADLKRPFSFEEILHLFDHLGESWAESFVSMMFAEAHARFHGYLGAWGINPMLLAGELLPSMGQRGAKAKVRMLFKRFGMGSDVIETIMRLTTLMMNVLNEDWPFEYDANDQTTEGEEAV